MTQMAEIVVQKVDIANLGGDQELLKNAIDIAMSISEYIQEHSYEIRSKILKSKADESQD